MGENRVIKLGVISDFFLDDLRCFKRGENSLSSGHLKSFQFDDNLKMIRGDVMASMRDKSYKVEVQFTSSYDIESATCTCPRGQFICHHMACVLLKAHYSVSGTDVSCSWLPRPEESMHMQGISADNLFDPLAGHEQDAASNRSTFKQALKDVDHNSGLLWLMTDEPENPELQMVPFVEDIIMSDQFINSDNKNEFLRSQLTVTQEKISEVSRKTIGQSSNTTWLIVKKHRLSASNFGAIIKASLRKSFPESLFKRLTGSYDIDRVKAVQWGRHHESDGIKALEKYLNMKVEKAGFILHPCGFIGASPDGFLCDGQGLVEVKCPFRLKDKNLKSNLSKTDIIYYENDKFIVNESHDYYHQIQGQLYCTQREYCYLVLWTTVDVEFIKISKNANWSSNLNVLIDFYFEHYIKYISK